MQRSLCSAVAILGLLLSTISLVTSRCAAQDTFPISDVATFDGKVWAGLTVGESTTAVIKKAYKTSKGAIRPEAMLLPQPANSTVRVDLLTRGRGEDSLLSGFRLVYSEGGPDLAALAATLKLEPETWYPRDHFDDWRLVTFPERGIVVFVEGTGRTERASMVLLCSPSHVRDVVSECLKQESPAMDVRDAFSDDKKYIELGSPHVFITVGKGITLEKSGDVSNRLESKLLQWNMPHEVALNSTNKGTWNINLSMTYSAKDKTTTLEASSDLTGSTLIGKLTSNGKRTDTYREFTDNPIWSGTAKLERTVYGAVEKSVFDMRDKVRKQAPPTMAALRMHAVDVMIDRATK